MTKFWVDLCDKEEDVYISLKDEGIPRLGSIALNNGNQPWISKWRLTSNGIRSLGIAAIALADHLEQEK